MDDEKRTVLVAALSVYAELLTKNVNQLDLEKGKGKGKESDDDVDLTIEIQKQIQMCGDLSERITSATSGSEIARIFEVADPESWKNVAEKGDELPKSWRHDSPRTSQNFYGLTSASSQPAKSSFPEPQRGYITEEEPYINPFTGLPVITETGFEAESSNSSLPPLRNAPKLPVNPPVRPASISGPPMRPASKPMHLRSQSAIISQPIPAIPGILPPQRPAPPPPPSLPPPPPEQQELKPKLEIEVPKYDDGLVTMIEDTEKEVVTEQRPDVSPSYNSPNIPPPPVYQPFISSSSLSIPETETWDDRQRAPRYEDEVQNPTHKNRYLRYISELASKAMKVTSSKKVATRPSSVYQPYRSPSLNTRHPDDIREELPAELPGNIINNEQPLNTPRRESLESLPPDYDSLSDINRRPSLASMSSAAGSRVWSLASPASSRSSLSPSSPSTSTSPDFLYGSTQASRRASYASSNSKIWKGNNRMSTQPSMASLQGIASSAIPNVPPRPQKIRTQSTTSLSTPTTGPGLMAGRTSPVTETQETQLGRRQTTSGGSKTGAGSGNFGNDQVSADAQLARHLSLDESHSRMRRQPATPFSKLQSIMHSIPQKTSYSSQAQKLRSSPPGSNNPWKDQMALDQAFARSLQQEEETELQMERDLLLAHKIANGTADDGDRDLAYFMHQESARSIIPITASPESVEQASYLWGMDPEALKQQIDWLEAHELSKTFKAQSSSDEASFLEAKRLQEQYDQEAKNLDAWEEWKCSNIEKCTSCLEEHPREELVRECEHGYCNGCLDEGFKAALESRTPFKCCKKALLIKDCIGLSAAFVTEYEEMILELSTPNPMFCCNAKCAKFLPPRTIVGDIGTCTKCKSQTCRHCRRKKHPGTFCAEDKETEAVKKLAKAKGWKTCPGCNHLIERRDGCLHMICSRCQTAFCYRCSKPWKDCESTCPDAISATHPKR